MNVSVRFARDGCPGRDLRPPARHYGPHEHVWGSGSSVGVGAGVYVDVKTERSKYDD